MPPMLQPVNIPSDWFPLTRRLVQWLIREICAICYTLGQAVEISREMIRFFFSGKLSWKRFGEHAAFVGWDTLGIALVLVTFSAMVISLQVAKEMVNQGAAAYVGALVSMAILRELAPIMTSVAVISMAGSAFAAELSTMQITEQVEAMKTLHVHPVRYLILPRVVAGMVMIPLMTMVTATVGILSGMFVSHAVADVGYWTYLDSVWRQTEIKDVLATLLKGGVFGYIIVILSTTIGIHTRGGAKEVGTATTRAVVWSFLTVAIFDYILTFLVYGAK